MPIARAWIPLLTLFVSSIFLADAKSASAAEDERHPNIVIILVDDMGYGDAGCYNADSKIPTPHIDSLAKAGMRFTDAHSAGPLCHMSRYGLLTGRYPFRINVSVWPKQPLIDSGQTTIASLLKTKGYNTAMVGKWHLGFQEQGYDKPLPGGPVDRGFESYFGIRASTDIPPYFYIRGDRAVEPPSERIAANNSEGWSPIQGAFWRAGGIAPNLKLKDVLPKFTEEAISVVEDHAENNKQKQAGQPLMLYLAYPAPHTPWLPDEKYLGKSGASMYGDFMVMVDEMIGRVLKSLDDNGLSEDTLVIFCSDNGPTWYPNDVERFGHDSAGGLRGMKADAWEAGHRVPFIVRWPGKVKPGSVSDQTICFTDVLATFAAITTGDNAGSRFGTDSFSFLPVLLGTQPENQPVRQSLPISSGSGMMTIRMGDWKLIEGLGSGGFSQPKRIKPEPGGPEGQLYNLKTDPAESENLYLERPEIVERLKQELKRIRQAG